MIYVRAVKIAKKYANKNEKKTHIFFKKSVITESKKQAFFTSIFSANSGLNYWQNTDLKMEKYLPIF